MKRRTIAATAAAIALLSASVARAQPSDAVSRADALFHAAKQLRDAGQYADACPQFAESRRLAPGVGVSLYLADCYERVGRTASAWAEFREAEQLARTRDDKRADIAHTRALALEPKLSAATIRVSPAMSRSGPVVVLDGAIIPSDRWNVPLAVDPGDHTVVLRVPGQASRTLMVHVGAGNRAATVPIDEGAAVGAAAIPDQTGAGAPPPTQERPPFDGGSTRRWIGIGLLAAGAVGVSIGTMILLNRSQAGSNAASCDSARGDDTATPASIVAFAAGGAALVAGLVLTSTVPSHKGVGIVAAPLWIAGGGGALVRGSF